MMLTDLADVLRAAGVKVVEVPGWKTRGRPGAFNPKGVLCHHTAGTSDSRAYIDWMATEGRTDLNPPLAQLGLSRTGIAYVMAAGRANHGGKMKAIAGLPAGDGNATLIGIEAMNSGFEGWSPAQYAAYVLICAALNNHYGWPASRTLGHKETSLSGKIDPGKMSMPDFRADVARKMAALKQPVPTTPPGVYPGTALKRGATGPKIAELQKALGLTADGSYGPGTETAIRAHQTAHGLTVDGVTGPATWASIFSPLTGHTKQPPLGGRPPTIKEIAAMFDTPQQLGEFIQDQVKLALIEMSKRATPIDRQAGSAFYDLVRPPVAAELDLQADETTPQES